MIVSSRFVARPVLQAILAPLLGLLAYDIVVTVLFCAFGQAWLGIEALPMSLLGSAIVFVVGVRNTLAWARWWEARTLWGSIVNQSRSLTRSALTLLGDQENSTYASRLVRLQIAYVHALRLALLRRDPLGEVDGLLPAVVSARVRRSTNVPFALQREMGVLLAEARRTEALDSVGLLELDGSLTELANAQGGCERIKNTPMPPQFDRFPGVLVFAYCILLPVGLVPDIGWFTPVAAAVIGFAFFVLDQVGRELASPFENRRTDVPVHALTRAIEIDLRQALGALETPHPLVPVGGVLW